MFHVGHFLSEKVQKLPYKLWGFRKELQYMPMHLYTNGANTGREKMFFWSLENQPMKIYALSEPILLTTGK